MSAPDPPPRRAAPGAAQLLQLGATCGVCIGAGALGGYLLDRVLDSSPLLVLVGLVIGIVAAAAGSFVLIRPYLTNASRGAPTPKD